MSDELHRETAEQPDYQRHFQPEPNMLPQSEDAAEQDNSDPGQFPFVKPMGMVDEDGNFLGWPDRDMSNDDEDGNYVQPEQTPEEKAQVRAMMAHIMGPKGAKFVQMMEEVDEMMERIKEDRKRIRTPEEAAQEAAEAELARQEISQTFGEHRRKLEQVITQINADYGCTLEMTTMAAPLQVEGQIDDYFLYFRSRWDTWLCVIATDQDSAIRGYKVGDEVVFFHSDDSLDVLDASWLEDEQLDAALRACLSAFRRGETNAGYV